MALRVPGGWTRCLGCRVLQASDCVCGQLGRKKRGSEIHGHVVGGTSRGDGLLASRDEVSLLTMRKTGQCEAPVCWRKVAKYVMWEAE